MYQSNIPQTITKQTIINDGNFWKAQDLIRNILGGEHYENKTSELEILYKELTSENSLETIETVNKMCPEKWYMLKSYEFSSHLSAMIIVFFVILFGNTIHVL